MNKPWDLRGIYRNLKGNISLQDIKDAAFTLGVDYDNLPGGKQEKWLELIRELERRNNAAGLINWLKQERPEFDLKPFDIAYRNRIWKFFGVSASPELAIYLSNLKIRAGRALDIDNVPRSYEGAAIPAKEMRAAIEFYSLPNVHVQLYPSPTTQEDTTYPLSFISLGSPAYNAASRFIENSMAPFARFDLVRGAIILGKSWPIRGEYAFIERLLVKREEELGYVFYVAGITEEATAGAARFLATKWEELEAKYQNNPKLVTLLGFSAQGNLLSIQDIHPESPQLPHNFILSSDNAYSFSGMSILMRNDSVPTGDKGGTIIAKFTDD